MARFSERYGHAPVRSVLQTDGMDDGLRNRLWNQICATFFATRPAFSGTTLDILSVHRDAEFVFKQLWHNYFKLTVDSIGHSYSDALAKLEQRFMSCKWYEV